MSGFSLLTLPKPGQLSVQAGMRPRLEGIQASGAGESHTQEANVAEVSHGEDGYSRTQISRQLDCHPVVSVSEGSETH